MTNTAPVGRWQQLSTEQRAAARERERQGDVISRLLGWRAVKPPGTGYWLMRAVKKGPEVPAAIQWERTEHEPGAPDNRMERSPILTARIAGDVVAWDRVWNWTKREIDRAEYEYRMADMDYAKRYAPHEPAANPRKKLDLMQAPLPF